MKRVWRVLGGACAIGLLVAGAPSVPAALLLRPVLGGRAAPGMNGFQRDGALASVAPAPPVTTVEARLQARLLAQAHDYAAAAGLLDGADRWSEIDRALLDEVAGDPVAAMHWTRAGLDVSIAGRLAEHAMVIGQPDDARAWTRRMLLLEPRTADEALAQSRAQRAAGDLTDARVALDRAVSMGLAARDGGTESAAILRAAGDPGAARAALARAWQAPASAATGESDLAYAEGWLCAYDLAPADAECALQRFQQAVSRDDFAGAAAAKSKADAQFQLGHQWMARRELAKARDSYLAATRSATDGSYFISLAIAEWALGERTAADGHVEDAVRAHVAQSRAAIWQLVGQRAEMLGMVDAAEAARQRMAQAR